MSRLQTQSNTSIRTMQYFTDDYRNIIKERDKSFYNENKSILDNFSYVIRRYTGNEYQCLNKYLREGVVSGNFNKKDLKSWAYCLHSSLQYRTSNVSNGTEVYRGIALPAPRDWKVGSRFYFGEFISTSKKINVAKAFAKGGTLLVITIKNNGTNGRNNYCRYVEDITQYPGEEEIIITAFCIFTIKRIEGNTYYLDCEGY